MINQLSFPCDKCGLCCQRVNQSVMTEYLDKGDGSCRYYDEINHLCLIYENRPDVCNIQKMYQYHFTNIITWHDFIELNHKVCLQLKDES